MHSFLSEVRKKVASKSVVLAESDVPLYRNFLKVHLPKSPVCKPARLFPLDSKPNQEESCRLDP